MSGCVLGARSRPSAIESKFAQPCGSGSHRLWQEATGWAESWTPALDARGNRDCRKLATVHERAELAGAKAQRIHEPRGLHLDGARDSEELIAKASFDRLSGRVE